MIRRVTTSESYGRLNGKYLITYHLIKLYEHY